jgi:predicted ferric reductase
MHSTLRTTARIVVYLALIVFPLVVASVFRPFQASDTLLVNFSIALGYIGFAIMALELLLVSRFEIATRTLGLDALQMYHKLIGSFAVVLVFAHPLLLLINGFPWRMYLPGPGVPWVIPLGTLSLVAVLALVALSVWRKRLHIPYETWQLSHGILTIVVLASAAIHILGIGRYAQTLPMQVVIGLYLLLPIVLFVYYRAIKPQRHLKQPWTVVENRVELGNARTLRLRAEGHPGWGFESGQFAWINLNRSPFGFEQHPISMSSCGDTAAETGEISFTIRDLGDWSGQQVPSAKPGQRVWLDGPYGVFSLDRVAAPGYALLGGGVGITPLYSMLLTMANRGDSRPVILFFGGPDRAGMTLHDEVLELESKINLKVVRVLSSPEADWQGERGYITADILRKYLPEKNYKRWAYIMCGPGPMIDAMEDALPKIGVPIEQIHAERFDMV